MGPRWLFPVLVGLLGEVKAVMPKVQPTRNPPPTLLADMFFGHSHGPQPQPRMERGWPSLTPLARPLQLCRVFGMLDLVGSGAKRAGGRL